MGAVNEQWIHQGELIRLSRQSSTEGGDTIRLCIVAPDSGDEKAISIDVTQWAGVVAALENAADDLNFSLGEELGAAPGAIPTINSYDDDAEDEETFV